jgi:hypothetical protein
MQYATQTKDKTRYRICGSMMIRKRRHKIDAPRSMSITTRSRPWWKRTIHAHASCIAISAYSRPMALAIRIKIFSTPASIPIRRVVSIPVALRSGVRMSAIRVRVPRRRARSGGRHLRASEGNIVPHSTTCLVYRARAAFRRGCRLASAGARSRQSSRELAERFQRCAGGVCLWGRRRVSRDLIGLRVRL